MNSRFAVLLAAGTAIIAIGLLFYPFSAGNKAPPPKPAQKLVKKDVLKVRSDIDWKHTPEAQLKEFTKFFEAEQSNRKDHVIGELETLVAEGETVITEGYEESPGTFVFSSLTPTVEKDEDGRMAVRVTAKSVKLDVSGNLRILFDTSTVLPTKGGGMIFAASAKGRSYGIFLSAHPDDATPLLRFTARDFSVELDKK